MRIDRCADGWHGLGTLSMALGVFERACILYVRCYREGRYDPKMVKMQYPSMK